MADAGMDMTSSQSRSSSLGEMLFRFGISDFIRDETSSDSSSQEELQRILSEYQAGKRSNWFSFGSTKTDALLKRSNFRQSAWQVSLSPCGTMVAILAIRKIVFTYTSRHNKAVFATLELPPVLHTEPRGREVAWCPDGKHLLILSADGEVVLCFSVGNNDDHHDGHNNNNDSTEERGLQHILETSLLLRQAGGEGKESACVALSATSSSNVQAMIAREGNDDRPDDGNDKSEEVELHLVYANGSVVSLIFSPHASKDSAVRSILAYNDGTTITSHSSNTRKKNTEMIQVYTTTLLEQKRVLVMSSQHGMHTFSLQHHQNSTHNSSVVTLSWVHTGSLPSTSGTVAPTSTSDILSTFSASSFFGGSQGSGSFPVVCLVASPDEKLVVTVRGGTGQVELYAYTNSNNTNNTFNGNNDGSNEMLVCVHSNLEKLLSLVNETISSAHFLQDAVLCFVTTTGRITPYKVHLQDESDTNLDRGRVYLSPVGLNVNPPALGPVCTSCLPARGRPGVEGTGRDMCMLYSLRCIDRFTYQVSRSLFLFF
jgi:hypothetical protein